MQLTELQAYELDLGLTPQNAATLRVLQTRVLESVFANALQGELMPAVSQRLEELLTPESVNSLPAETLNPLLVSALKYLAGRIRVPLPVFEARLKAFPTVAIELVTACWMANDVNDYVIQLVQRPDTDVNFAGQWHTPGVTLLNRQSLKDAFSALAQDDETGITLSTSSVRLAGWINMPHEQRGHYASPVFVRTLPEQPANCAGEWFPASRIYELNLVRSHRIAVLPMALSHLNGGTPYWMELPPNPELATT